MKEKLRAWALWALPRLIYLVFALVKVSYYFIFLLYERVGSFDTTILIYGLVLVIFFMKQPYADDIPGSQKIILWCSAIILLCAYVVFVAPYNGDFLKVISV